MSLQESIKQFPDGMRVVPNKKYSNYNDFKFKFNKYESRGYMIVKGRKQSDGWLRFDNKEFTLYGGSWNYQCFEPIGMESILDDSLFEL